ncbi:hypothetical protein CerSpe_216680 [Prunus speciosa]
MEDKHSQPHAIMVPIPLQGHLIPHIHLATKLASHGFTITSVNTQHINHQITNIRYKTVSDGFPLAFNRFQNHN